MNPDTPRSSGRDIEDATFPQGDLTASSASEPLRPDAGSAAELPGAPLPTGTAPSGSSRLFGSVKQKATSQLNAQKYRATDELDQIAQTVRDSTARLRTEHHDIVAQVVERAADQLERFAGHLRDRDIGELLAEVEQFGRRQPALFIGSTFAAGLLAARFLKASTRTNDNRIWYEEGRS